MHRIVLSKYEFLILKTAFQILHSITLIRLYTSAMSFKTLELPIAQSQNRRWWKIHRDLYYWTNVLCFKRNALNIIFSVNYQNLAKFSKFVIRLPYCFPMISNWSMIYLLVWSILYMMWIISVLKTLKLVKNDLNMGIFQVLPLLFLPKKNWLRVNRTE